jgi:hypothetical protein
MAIQVTGSSVKKMWLLCAVIVAIGCLIIIIVSNAGNHPQPQRVPALTSTNPAKLTPISTPTLASTPSPSPLPVGAAFDNPSTEKGFACFGAGSCLDDSGWYDLVWGDWARYTYISDIAQCPDGTVLMGGGFGIGVWNGKS